MIATKRPAIVQDPADWEAGLAGGKPAPHPRAGTLGYSSGLIEGKAYRAIPPEQRKNHFRTPNPTPSKTL
ncbi:MAG: hypothetical protein ACXWUF_11865 [Methylomagnum sp.]